MAKTYAIGDIHGRLDLLQAAYGLIGRNEPGRIVHLGDYVDRGKQSQAVIEFLMTEASLPSLSWQRVILKGNHEEMMVQALRRKCDPFVWASNGGDATLVSYGHPKIRGLHRGNVFPFNPDLVPRDHVVFLDALPLYFCDAHRVYVHAAVDPEIGSLPEQMEQVLTWGLYRNGEDVGFRGAHVVHGHHQQKEPLLLKNRTNLDIGACFSGCLAIGVFDDAVAGGPIEIIEATA